MQKPREKREPNPKCLFIEEHKEEDSYYIGNCVSKQETCFPMGIQTGNRESKAKTPSGGEGTNILWPQNNDKKIYKMWIGRKYKNASPECTNILRQIQKVGK